MARLSGKSRSPKGHASLALAWDSGRPENLENSDTRFKPIQKEERTTP